MNDPAIKASLNRISANTTLRIRQARIVHDKFHVGISFACGLAALASLVPAFQWLLQSGRQSGFFSYVSLLTSDGLSSLFRGQAWFLSLADSLPILEVLVTVGILLALGMALKYSISSLYSLSVHQRQTVTVLLHTNK